MESNQSEVRKTSVRDDVREDAISREVARWKTGSKCEKTVALDVMKCSVIWVEEPGIPRPLVEYLDALLEEKKEEIKEAAKDSQLVRFCNRKERDTKGEKDICLADWWYKVQELDLYPFTNDKQMLKLKQSYILKYVYKAELFRETFGDSAVPVWERLKRRRYEQAAGLPYTEYEKAYNRKRVYDPLVPTRYNKRRRLMERYEDNTGSWISRHDEKPCGCSKCTPCERCGETGCG